MLSESFEEIDYWLRIMIGVMMILVLLMVLYEAVLVLRAIRSLRELELMKEVVLTVNTLIFLTGSVTVRDRRLN